MSTEHGRLPAILFVDAYDSFTNNIISLLTTTLHCSVRVLHIDTPLFSTQQELVKELKQYDAVVLGPGPGNPNNSEDVGLMNRIWEASGVPRDESEEDVKVDIPILGICLGFQSLGLKCRHIVRRLKGGGLHGIVRRVNHSGTDIYHGVGELDVTLYQSLTVDKGQYRIKEDQWRADGKWLTDESDMLQPLGWVELGEAQRDQRILVAARHKERPWWGMQYHPESICTNEESKETIINWMAEVNEYNRATGRRILQDGKMRGDMPVRESLLAQVEDRILQMNGSRIPHESELEECDYVYQSIKLLDADRPGIVSDIVAILQAKSRDMIVLESTNQSRKSRDNPISATVRGRYSILALNLEKSTRIDYSVGDKHATLRPPNKRAQPNQIPLASFGGIWPFLASYLKARRIDDGDLDTPFWGGFMGCTTYELGLEGISVAPHSPLSLGQKRADLSFAWVTHSIVVDHETGSVHLQQLISSSLLKTTRPWWEHTCGSRLVDYLQKPVTDLPLTQIARRNSFSLAGTVVTPAIAEYEAAVHTCQSHISAGDSYELCLTDQSELTVPVPARHPLATFPSNITKSAPDSTSTTYAWSLYNRLGMNQPAPFASFIRLGHATFISCSPERFLKWNERGRCELRPMKGTVKKSIAPTLQDAEKLLHIDKETAENLMIVDLVRHDLYGVCGAGNVHVEQLMRVEEYKSVWQMVSVVVGDIPGSSGNNTGGAAAETNELPHTVSGKGSKERLGYSGVDVLAASLPPGSMTGAPKKRSCELLNGIEKCRRSLYSGVVGYMDVGGRGDWSVNIRCAFRWDDESTGDSDVWHVGAGGAVTALSNAVGEREEMETKLFNTLGGLGYGPNVSAPTKQ